MPLPPPHRIIYAAPLQGYTERGFRRAHALTIGGIAEYVTPFARLEKNDFRKRDLKDLQTDDDLNAMTVPQILVKTADETRKLAVLAQERGFKRLDINAGCPFPKVTDAGYGAAILQRPKDLAAVLAAATDDTPSLQLSVKLRLPTPSDEPHLRELASILNDVPLCHVVLHPRCLRKPEPEHPDIDAFLLFQQLLRHPLVYNGDITSADVHPPVNQLMIGRGLLQNPLLPWELQGQSFSTDQRCQRLLAYHQALVTELTASEQQPLPKLKTVWDYFLPQATGRLRKKVIKAATLEDYRSAAQDLIVAAFA